MIETLGWIQVMSFYSPWFAVGIFLVLIFTGFGLLWLMDQLGALP